VPAPEEEKAEDFPGNESTGRIPKSPVRHISIFLTMLIT
jgi:hypothetical protein